MTASPRSDMNWMFGLRWWAGSSYGTERWLGWKAPAIESTHVGSTVSGIETAVADSARLLRRNWLCLGAFVIYAVLLFQPTVWLVRAGIYASPTMLFAYVTLVAGCIFLIWPAFLVFATIPRMIRVSMRMRRDMFALAESVRVDSTVAGALQEEVQSGRAPRLALISTGKNPLAKALRHQQAHLTMVSSGRAEA